MLLEISITNFRSIKDTQIFSMLSSNGVKEHPDNVRYIDGKQGVLKTGIIYGRNASGKSNVLSAISAIDYLVTNSDGFKLNQDIPPYEPFRLDENSSKKPVELELDFIAQDNIRYKYILSFNKKEFIKESLFYYPKKQPAKLFVREKGNPIDYGAIKGNKKIIEEDLLDNQLFLSKSSSSKLEQLNIPYQYFTEYFYSHITHESYNEDRIISDFTKTIKEDNLSFFKENLDKLICAADTGIDTFEISEYTEEDFKLPSDLPDSVKKSIIEENRYQMRTVHSFNLNGKKNKVLFNLEDESTGTKKLIAVGGLILSALYNGGVIVIDELDKSLHPLLTRNLIAIFHNPITNPNNAQLIFASHDVTLLNHEIFRRDQIWFAEKDKSQVTTIYSLSDIRGVRPSHDFERNYMAGRFRATPIFNDLVLDFKFGDEKKSK